MCGKACLMWQSLQRVVDTGTTVESSTADTFKALQGICNCVVGLTARTADIKDATTKQLESADIHFYSENTETNQESVFTPNPSYSSPADKLDRPVALHKGVLYCCGPKKPKAILEYIRKRPALVGRLGCNPLVIAVDDRKSHLQAISEAIAAQGGLDFVGVHYTRMAGEESAELDATTVLLAKVLTSKAAIADVTSALQLANSEGTASR
jgi:hypothetical protein